mmetsp:Transcript_45416/g.135785  ORF Transcript_45416/g.135785 Transcript_45416/m.135785 type:complete len:277 (+) Transcript_45416:433-1263(+)
MNASAEADARGLVRGKPRVELGLLPGRPRAAEHAEGHHKGVTKVLVRGREGESLDLPQGADEVPDARLVLPPHDEVGQGPALQVAAAEGAHQALAGVADAPVEVEREGAAGAGVEETLLGAGLLTAPLAELGNQVFRNGNDDDGKEHLAEATVLVSEANIRLPDVQVDAQEQAGCSDDDAADAEQPERDCEVRGEVRAGECGGGRRRLELPCVDTRHHKGGHHDDVAPPVRQHHSPEQHGAGAGAHKVNQHHVCVEADGPVPHHLHHAQDHEDYLP